MIHEGDIWGTGSKILDTNGNHGGGMQTYGGGKSKIRLCLNSIVLICEGTEVLERLFQRGHKVPTSGSRAYQCFCCSKPISLGSVPSQVRYFLEVWFDWVKCLVIPSQHFSFSFSGVSTFSGEILFRDRFDLIEGNVWWFLLNTSLSLGSVPSQVRYLVERGLIWLR